MHSDSRDGSRVRQIPIFVESRDNNSSNGGFNHTQQQSNQQRFNTSPNPYEQQRHQEQQNFHNYNSHDKYSQTLPNKSSVNINPFYKPYVPSPNDKGNQTEQEPGLRSFRTNSSNKKQLRQEQDLARESKNSETSGNNTTKPINEDLGNKRKQSVEFEKIDPRVPIPMPPPPAPSQSEKIQNQGDNGPKQSGENSEQLRRQATSKSGQLNLIGESRLEVNEILQQIKLFEGLSNGSKEFLVLDDMLEKRIIKLDGIDSNELRPQRKAIISIAQQATKILNKKLELNQDIQKLFDELAA